MKSDPILLSEKTVLLIRRAMFASIGIGLLAICFCGLRLLQSKSHLADLAERVKIQRGTLAQMRQTTTKPPEGRPDNAHIDAVAKVQAKLEESVKASGCQLSEFQVAADRQPYLSLFTLDTNSTSSEQIQVHVTLSGKLPATIATLEALRKADTPIEPDSIEITRDSVLKGGIAQISMRLVFRILVPAGGTA